jgi:Ca2+-binding EF-hand superfamily protein
MKMLLISGAVAAALVAGSAAIAQAPEARATMAAKTVTRADVQAKVAQHFARLDANRDGFVTKAEADATKANRMHKRADKRAERQASRFDRLDANNDGSITRAEFDAKQALRKQRVAARDHNGDGRPDRRMHRKGGGMGMGFGGRMFAMADANRDSRVSMQEATAVAFQHFDMADANRDGRITPDERKQMHQRMRAQHHQARS